MRKDKPQWGTQVKAVAKEDDGIGMHEMAEALLHAIYEYGFPWISDGSYFEIRLIQRENEQREKKKRGFWFCWFCVVLFFLFRGSNQNRIQKERKKGSG